MTRIRQLSILAAVLAGALVAGACSSNGSAGDGVASLSSADGESAAATDDGNDEPTEEEILAWVECMRGEGLDIDDPTVDGDGQLVLGPRVRIGGGGTGGGASSSDDDNDDDNDSAAQPANRESFEAAIGKCGDPPRMGGAFSEEDRQAMQDSLLKMAQCLRGEGLDVADPDFSNMGPGGAARVDDNEDDTANDDANGGRVLQVGPFNLDMDDPKVQAAFDKCQAELGDAFPRPGGARGPRQTSSSGRQ